MSLQVEQDVACLDVSVDFPLKVQVFKSPQCILQHNGYLLFSELCGGEVHSLELLQRTMRIKLQTPLPPFLPPAANQQMFVKEVVSILGLSVCVCAVKPAYNSCQVTSIFLAIIENRTPWHSFRTRSI